MKSFLKWLGQNKTAAGVAVVVGALLALFVGDTWAGVLSGTLTMFVTGWVLKAGWLSALDVTSKEIFEFLEEWRVESRSGLIESNLKRKRASARRRMIRKTVKLARRESPLADKGWRILTFLNGGITERFQYQMISLVVLGFPFIILHVVLALLGVPGKIVAISVAVTVGSMMLLTLVSLFPLLNFPSRGYRFGNAASPLPRKQHASQADYIRSQNGLEYLLGEQYDRMTKADNLAEDKLLECAITYLERICRKQYLHPLLMKYVDGEVSLAGISVREKLYGVVNMFWLPIFVVLVVLRAIFVFANHETRVVAFSASVTGGLYLAATHLFFGGLLWGNLNFWLLLAISVVISGAAANHFATKKGLLGFSFNMPQLRIKKVEEWKH